MLAAIHPPESLSATSEALSRIAAASARPSEFELDTATGKVRLQPWYSIQREPYSVYFNLTGRKTTG
jgi:hypothetical protein